MTTIIVEGEIPSNLSEFDNYQVYNCLDAAITSQLCPELKSQLDEDTAITYEWERKVHAICLEMSIKGLPVDQMALAELDWRLEKQQRRCLKILNQLTDAIGAPITNPNSTKAVPYLFYEHLGIPAVYSYDRKTKERKVVSDIKALEKIRGSYPIAVPFVNAILAYREVTKLRSVFKRGLEPGSGNLRGHFSPSGTETGRLSSQQNPYGRGTNLQNLTDEARSVVCAPEGFALINLDLKTAESIAVGFISRCRSYIDACLSGDLHTAVSRLNWPELGWTDDLKKDKAIAESPYYRHFSYRDMAKRGGHGTNYYGKAPTLAKVLNLPTPVVQDFQDKYFERFPEISEWHLRVISQLMIDGTITTQAHRKRRFWGRPDDAATHREAIAFDPQSLVAHVCNVGLYQCQRWLLRECPEVSLLAQIHDAGLFIAPLHLVHDVIPELQKHFLVSVDFNDLGVMQIPSDASIGLRWNKAPKKGGSQLLRQGLMDYSPNQPLHWLANAAALIS